MSFATEHSDLGKLHFRGAPANTLFDDGQVSHLPSFMQSPIVQFSHSIGLPSSIVVLVLCQFVSLPLAFIHHRLRSVVVRHVYSVFWGAMFLFLMFGFTSLHLIGLSACVYVIVPAVPKGKAHSIVFFLAMGYLACGHLYQTIMHFGVYSVDITAPLMVAAMKLIIFACNWDDALRLQDKERLHRKEHIHKFYEEEALRSYPSPLEFASYMLFYGAVSSGPVYCLREYRNFQDHSVYRKDGFQYCPPSWYPCLLALVYAVFSYGGMFISGYFPLPGVLDSAEFLDKSFPYRLAYMCVGVALYRTRYYITWYLAEASCIAAGLGYGRLVKNEDGAKDIDWERVNNVRVLAIESGSHIHELTDHWNRRVSETLKYYVYFRVSGPRWLTSLFGGPRTFAMLATRVTSAFWHGFYIPYYMFFVSVILLNEADRLLRRHIEPLTKDENGKNRPLRHFFYSAFCKFLTFSCMNYFGSSFTLLVASSAWAAWRATNFYGHVACIVVIVVMKLLFTEETPSKPAKKAA